MTSTSLTKEPPLSDLCPQHLEQAFWAWLALHWALGSRVRGQRCPALSVSCKLVFDDGGDSAPLPGFFWNCKDSWRTWWDWVGFEFDPVPSETVATQIMERWRDLELSSTRTNYRLSNNNFFSFQMSRKSQTVESIKNNGLNSSLLRRSPAKKVIFFHARHTT